MYTLDERYFHQLQYYYQQKSDKTADNHYQNSEYIDRDPKAEDGIEKEHDTDRYERVNNQRDWILNKHEQ
jgi:alpha-glucuronidase